MSALHSSLQQRAAVSWSVPQAGQWMALVILRHAERQPDIGLVGSGLLAPSAWGNKYQSGEIESPNSAFALSRSRNTAENAPRLRGITLSPAVVLERWI